MTENQNIKTILIADDSFSNLNLLAKRLKYEGYNILTAIDGKQAIAIAQSKNPDLILIEKKISKIDGLIVSKVIKSNRLTSNTSIILLADQSEFIHNEKDYGLETENILYKPINIDDLVTKIKNVFSELKQSNEPKTIAHSSKKKILLVEDNELNQAYILALLNDLGFEADVVDNGEDALDSFLSGFYDLVLTDINVPLISGIELSIIIRNKYSSNVPIIAITGHSEKELMDKCMGIGMNAFITKPFQAKQLSDIIIKELLDTEQNIIEWDKVVVIDDFDNKKYNYSQAIKLSNGDDQLFKKWLGRFLSLVRIASDFVNTSIKTKDFTKRNKVFHELINYSGYFGVDELRLYIKELQSIQRFSTDCNRLENFYKKIQQELNAIEEYFKDFN